MLPSSAISCSFIALTIESFEWIEQINHLARFFIRYLLPLPISGSFINRISKNVNKKQQQRSKKSQHKSSNFRISMYKTHPRCTVIIFSVGFRSHFTGSTLARIISAFLKKSPSPSPPPPLPRHRIKRYNLTRTATYTNCVWRRRRRSRRWCQAQATNERNYRLNLVKL